MVRTMTLLAVLGASLHMAPAHGAAPPPICRLPVVVEVATNAMQLNSHYSRFDPAFITEAPTLSPTLVRCEITLAITAYDTKRFAGQPMMRYEVRAFTVRTVANGFVVQIAR